MKSDKQLQHDVLAELEWEPSVEASQIGVAATDGVITLTGQVGTYLEKTKAEEVSKRVYGVRAVANDIAVKIGGQHARTDAEIATAALNSLKWDADVDDEKLKIAVRDGWVTLEGQATWKYQADAAERDVRVLTGVRGVTNKISVVSPVRTADVQKKIEEAFRRSAEVDARRVEVHATDGRIVLRGNVRSWAERAEAQQAAWAAPGVVNVENNLIVMP
jgi:osmotically-inducible protein OsmY